MALVSPNTPGSFYIPKELYNEVRKIAASRAHIASQLSTANTILKKIEENPDKMATKDKQDLKLCYENALKFSQDEEIMLRACHEKMTVICEQAARLRRPGDGGPQKRAKQEMPGAMGSSVPMYSSSAMPMGMEEPDIITVGQQVAARPKGNDDFILCTVSRAFPEKNKYEVIDEDPGDPESGAPPTITKHTLHRSAIIPLPVYDGLNLPPLELMPYSQRKLLSIITNFRTNQPALALFPDSTTFYYCQILQLPKKRGKELQYVVQFNDDNNEETGEPVSRKIPFKHVVPYPDCLPPGGRK